MRGHVVPCADCEEVSECRNSMPHDETMPHQCHKCLMVELRAIGPSGALVADRITYTALAAAVALPKVPPGPPSSPPERDRLTEIEAAVRARTHACSQEFGAILGLRDGCDACLLEELLHMANGRD